METKPVKKQGVMIRPSKTVKRFLDEKKRETGMTISAWITMLIVREMEKKTNEN